MDADPCGRFKLAFKFKLFTVGIPDSYQFFFAFCLTVLVPLDIYLSGLSPILPYVSIVFLL